MNPREIKAKIEKLEKKINDLQKVYKGDVCESFREATQTQEMIVMYKLRIDRLKELLA